MLALATSIWHHGVRGNLRADLRRQGGSILRLMAEQLSYHFLLSAQRNLLRANEHLGRGPGRPGGGVDPNATEQELANHAALVEVVEALEHFENWATELSVRLEGADLVQLLREAP